MGLELFFGLSLPGATYLGIGYTHAGLVSIIELVQTEYMLMVCTNPSITATEIEIDVTGSEEAKKVQSSGKIAILESTIGMRGIGVVLLKLQYDAAGAQDDRVWNRPAHMQSDYVSRVFQSSTIPRYLHVLLEIVY